MIVESVEHQVRRDLKIGDIVSYRCVCMRDTTTLRATALEYLNFACDRVF